MLVAFALAVQMPMLTPRSYVALRAPESVVMDGRVDTPFWRNAPWTEDFVDIADGPKPRFRTRAKMLWDDTCLYVGAEMEEPQVWATLTEHDSVVFHDNDFEVFIDPNDDNQLYTELEMNALNTTWDLLLVRPYRAGGPPVDAFELKGLRTAVHVDGELNDPDVKDRGWSVEIAIPWKALEQIAGCPCPPRDEDQWRVNFSRVEWHVNAVNGRYEKVPNTREDNWVWSPQGVVDMHRPEHWGIVQFSSQTSGAASALAHPGLNEKFVLCRLWDAEDEFRQHHRRWGSLGEINFREPGVNLFVGRDVFEATYNGYAIDQNLRFWKISSGPSN